MNLVIYKPGELHLNTTVMNGFCLYTAHKSHGRNLTVEEYLEVRPDCVCITMDEAMNQIRDAEDKIAVSDWTEISQSSFIDALEILPPEKHRSVNGAEIFRMCEYQTSNITAQYVSAWGRYFKAYKRTSEDYEDLVSEVLALT